MFSNYFFKPGREFSLYYRVLVYRITKKINPDDSAGMIVIARSFNAISF